MWDLISNYLGPLITTVTAFIFMKFILKKEIKIAPIYVVVIILFVPSIASLSILDNYMFLCLKDLDVSGYINVSDKEVEFLNNYIASYI